MSDLTPLPLMPLPDPIYRRLESISPAQQDDVVLDGIDVTFGDVLSAARDYAPVHTRHDLSHDSAVLSGIAHCLTIRGYAATPYRIFRFVFAIEAMPWTVRASA